MPSPSDLKLALLIQANAAQAKAELAQVQAQLKGVEASAATAGTGAAAGVTKLTDASAAAATAAAATSDAAADAAQAVNAWGETAEQSAARIRAVAQAATAQRNAATAATAAANRTTDAAATTSVAYRDLAAAQTASMQVGTRAFLARAQGLAILEKTKLTTADVARAEQLLGVAVAGGAMSQKMLVDTLAQVDASKVKDAVVQEAATKATQANTRANLENAVSQKTLGDSLNYRSRREVGTMAAEGLSGNFGRVRTSGLALANDMGVFTKLLSPAGLAIAAVTAAIAAMVAAEISGERETLAFGRALAASGTQAGVTGGELAAMASRIGASTGAYGDATKAVMALTRAGQGASPALEGMATLAVRFGQAMGDTKAGIELATVALTGNAQQVDDLDKKYDLLTATQANEVQHLFAIGDADKARQLIMREGSAALAARAKDVDDSAGRMIRAWNAVTSAVSGAWNAMKQADSNDAGARLAVINTQIERLSQGATPDTSSPAMQRLLAQQAQLRAQLVAEGWKRTNAAMDTARQKAAKAAQDWANKSLAPIDALQSKLDQATHAKDAFFSVPRTAEESARFMRSYNQQIQQAAQTYASATKTPAGAGAGRWPSLDALAGGAQVAAVRKQLAELQNAWQNAQRVLDAQHKAGQLSDRQYYATLLADLDAYTQKRVAALEAEKAAAQAHAKTAADRIRVDQQVARIDSEITQTQQDAAAKRMQIEADEQKAIDDARKAWVQMAAALGVPVSINTSEAVEKLKQLQALFDKLQGTANAPTAEQMQQAIQGTLTQGVQAQPNYRSLRNIPGAASYRNPLGQANQDIGTENSLYRSNETSIGQAYAAEMAAAQGNAQALQRIQKAYDAASEQEQQRHSQVMQKLQEAQYWGGLQTASNALGQLAALASSQNRKVAAVGKAAAIAQAIITTYKNATVAYGEGLEAGGPYAGPALGAAYAAIAVAAGMANVAAIRSQPSGYVVGGYTGNAPVTQPVGFVHGREGVLSAPEVRAIGGEAGFNALRRSIRGYAEGGYVHPLANAPSPAALGFSAPRAPGIDFSRLAETSGAGAAPGVGVRIVNTIDPEFATSAMNSPAGEKVIMNILGRNQMKLKQMVR